MDILIGLFAGATIFLCGYLTCLWSDRRPTATAPRRDEKETVMIKRSRPNFQNPLSTNRVEESPYERNNKGLYELVKPGNEKTSRSDRGD